MTLTATTTTLSGITPTGRLTLGNYLGALGRFAAQQEGGLYGIMNLHAMTVEHAPAVLAHRTREAFGLLLASGLDPERAVVFVQGDVPAHTELAYLLECTASFGEMRRMIQFKEKSAHQRSVRLSLLTYPALMAADILLYGTDRVPVGADQSQHVELARDLALRFNQRYGNTFAIPELSTPDSAARVMNLADPTRKMSKTAPDDDPGVVRLLDTNETIARKVSRAVTDEAGVDNLRDILRALTGTEPPSYAGAYRALKDDVTQALLTALTPVRAQFTALAADPYELDRIRRLGAARAMDLATPTLARARLAMGLAG
jgi:tryptophanyl-tRNA synthetase